MSELPFAVTLDAGSSRANHTGTWRVERPVYVDRLPPCNDACPAGENIQHWLYDAEAGSYEAAWRTLVEDNPLPAICGRVCFHPCEAACNRGKLDEAVGIHAVERFLGDAAIAQGWRLPAPAAPSGRRVLVVGAGPSGLSVAYHLTRLGHEVEIREAAPRPGGMLRYGIPKYRLPREVIDAEVAKIGNLGVVIRCGLAVTDIAGSMEEGGFDAAYLAFGAQLSHRVQIPAADSARVLDALAFLAGTEAAEPPAIGRRVVVYGGGDTAMDAARSAKRLGATEAVIVYRRNRERMPAHPVEVEEALAEGVTVRWLSTIARVNRDRIVIEKMELDTAGFPQPTGEFTELGADCVILALGQDADLAPLAALEDVEVRDGAVVVDAHLMTGRPGVFAGGDMVPADRTVTVAIGHGKRAARNIDRWLAGAPEAAAPRHNLAAFDKLNTWYYADAPRTVQPELEAVRRQTGFEEVVGGLDGSNALYEARRCLSCGNCFECDNCYGVCPDNAVSKLGPGERYAFDYDYCKGCGICVAECPCGAIVMVPELI
ncbi:MAG: NAD(P)-binding protein [Acidimicrobiales bacterium]|jgi:NADPH-dependent glutamate synthase beta subunit-like oxidoreductase